MDNPPASHSPSADPSGHGSIDSVPGPAISIAPGKKDTVATATIALEKWGKPLHFFDACKRFFQMPASGPRQDLKGIWPG
jgi:hypothetical protein